jgi:hypothetical protein
MRLFSSLSVLFSAVILSACGGGSEDEYTSTLTTGNSTWICKSEVAKNTCISGNCSSCTCSSGACSAGTTFGAGAAAKVRLNVGVSPQNMSLAITPQTQIQLALSNPASVGQNVTFDLQWPLGPTSNNGVGFSSPCTMSSFVFGGSSMQASLFIPGGANCSMTAGKTPSAGLNQTFTFLPLSSNVELNSALPELNVTP